MTTFSYIIAILYESYIFNRYIVSTRDTLKMHKSEWDLIMAALMGMMKQNADNNERRKGKKNRYQERCHETSE